MNDAEVIGPVRADVRHDSLIGVPLMLVQITDANHHPDGPPIIAIDSCGVQAGDRVVITSDGSLVDGITGRNDSPARWSIMGVIDT